LWRKAILSRLRRLQLTVVIGQHAQAYHLPDAGSLTEAVPSWREHWPAVIALPHPSPRNNLWLKRHPWFEADVVPNLRLRVREVLDAR
jgi:uracil-DNA glycosylase